MPNVNSMMRCMPGCASIAVAQAVVGGSMHCLLTLQFHNTIRPKQMVRKQRFVVDILKILGVCLVVGSSQLQVNSL